MDTLKLSWSVLLLCFAGCNALASGASERDASIESDASVDANVDGAVDGAADAQAQRDSGLPDAGPLEPPPPLPGNICEGAQTGLRVHANAHTLGVELESSAAATGATAEVSGSDGMWHPAPTPVQVGGLIATSVFQVEPNRNYAVRITVGGTTYCATTRTLPLVLPNSALREVYVAQGGSGDGSQASPFGSIQAAADAAQPGDRIHVARGEYHETVSVRHGGEEGRYVQFLADEGVVLNGGIAVSDFRSEGDNVYSAAVPAYALYLARDDQRFFNYDTRANLMARHGGGNCRYGAEPSPALVEEGWAFDAGRLYVRTTSNPAGHRWNYAVLPSAFAVSADYVWIEGFTVHSYGTTDAATIDVKASHFVFRDNAIRGGRLGVYVYRSANNPADDALIEHNEFSDAPTFEFEWCGVKASTMEGFAVGLAGGRGGIVRDNNIHDIFNGVYTGGWAGSGAITDAAVAHDVDVYNNIFRRIGDDGFEPEGPSINNRFRDNDYMDGLCPISVAPVRTGPAWIVRNVLGGVRGAAYKVANGSTGAVLIYHNTSWSVNEPGHSAQSWYFAANRMTFHNNIFGGTWLLLRNPYGGEDNHFDYNNWYTSFRESLFGWGPESDSGTRMNKDAFCSRLGFECHGWVQDPGLVNPNGGDYHLQAESPNRDRGVRIPGINDSFLGSGPDVGAYEM